MTDAALALLLALLLDAALGEPRWLWTRLPHPAVLMGRAVDLADTRLNRGALRRLKGALALSGLALLAASIGWAIAAIPGTAVDVAVAAILLAQRSLADHVRAVAEGLRRGLTEGRAAVAMIVGRDTTDMTPADVSRAAIESAAENFSDGVVAPAVWFLVAGVPGILIYKMVNTADSMIGHRTPRHAAFGWAAARSDDLLNLVPARLAAGLIWLTGPGRCPVGAIRRDARTHRSPNAGWPEAAMAHRLGIALGGPRSYDGAKVEAPYLNPAGAREAEPGQICACVRVLWMAWLALAGLTAALAIV